MKSQVLSTSPAKAACFLGEDIYAASSIDVLDEAGNIVAFRGALTRFRGGEASVLARSDETGFTAVTALPDGRLVVAERGHGLAVLDGAGARLHSLATDLGAPTEWLAIGGSPLRVFAATTWSSSSKKSATVVELDPVTWQKKHVSFTGQFLPCLSEVGVTRINKDKRIAEYAWKGAPKAVTEPAVSYGIWRIARVASGWFLHATTSMFLDLAGKVLWTGADRFATFPGATAGDVATSACSAGGDRLLIGTPRSFFLVDGPSGTLLASCERQAPLTREAPHEGNLSWNGGTHAVAASAAGIERLSDLPPFAGATASAATTPPAEVKAAKSAKSTKSTKVKADAASPHEGTVATLETLVQALSETDDAERARALRLEIDALDVFAAQDDDRLAKRIDKAIRKLQARVRKVKDEGVRKELTHALDALTSS